MVLLNSEVHCNNGQKGIYFLAAIIVYASITMFISSIYNCNITITLEKKTQISTFQIKKLSFCSSDVLRTFLYKKSRAQVKIFKQNL